MTHADAELRERDARGRLHAQTVFRAPLVLEAGAGTGKTTALVARIAAWSLGAGWERALEAAPEADPQRIARRVLSGTVAITFTDAAAAEMARRVGEALLAIEQGRPPPGLLDEALPIGPDARVVRARALRGALDHLGISTIHAWCRRLLGAHPMDAGLHARLEIDADGRLRREVAREILEPRLREAYAAGDERLFALAGQGVGPREIEAEILALLDAGLPARAFDEDPFSAARVGALAERLRSAARAVCEAGAPLAGSRARVSAQALACAAQLAERLGEKPTTRRDELVALVAWLVEHVAPYLERFRKWARADFGAGDRAALGAGCDALAGPADALARLVATTLRIDVARLDLGRAVFRELLAEVERALRARGVASFHDLVDAASRLLVGNPRIAAALQAQIDQLLVDEFQDTDARQCDLLRAVALEGPEDSRPGLFVVGDPKQSIYGWRSADLTAYDAFVADALAAGGRREVLHVNYRSVPAVLDEVERVVAPVMHERPGIQPRFEPLVASDANRDGSGFASGGRRPTEYWVANRFDPESGQPQATRVRDATRLEARALALDLRELHDEHGVPWRHFGVLLRSRSDWDVYLAALREHQVPFAVEGDRSYYRRREIVDAAALVRCVLDPNDHLALLTLLRSAMVGVPDAALLPLWAGDLPRRLTELEGPDPQRLAAIRACVDAARLPDGVPGLERVASWRLSLGAAAEALGELRRCAREDPADVFVEALRTSLLLEAAEAARYQGAWRAANLDRFFRELLADLEGGADFHRVLRRLRSALAEEQDAEEGRPREVLEDAVQILTIHGAKGLDFEHVYVMQLHKGPPTRRPAQVELRNVGGCLEYRVLGAATPGWDRAEREQSRVEEAERVRTLYVAVTRARQRLVLSGLWPDPGARRAGRAIDLVSTSLEGGAPARLGEVFAPGACAGVDARGARWLLLARATEPDRAGARGALAPDAQLDEEAIAAASARLQAARREMRRRMARPLGAAASGDPHENPEDAAQRGWSRERAPLAETGVAVTAAVGSALHRALECFDFAGDPGVERERAEAVAARALQAALPAKQRDAALERARDLLIGFTEGPLLARLRALAPHIVARELPVLVAPDASDEAIDYVSGALDLVYADPESGRLVVADYKTGARRDYARQGAQYQRALRHALGLDYEPRFELWYLDEGAVVTA